MTSTLQTIILSFFVCCILTVTSGLSAADKRPNVLFIICDDLNTHVSSSGYQHIITPTFQAFAEQGMTFERAYCQYPVCGPSRASMLSGLYPESTGIISNVTDIRNERPNSPSLPGVFKDAGYWTARTGKIFHNDKTNPPEVWDENPERFYNDEMAVEKAAREAFEAEHGVGSTTKRATREQWKEFAATQSTQTRGQNGYGPSGLTDEQHRDGKNVKQVSKYLRDEAFGDQPFFIACGIHKPHVPYLAPDKYFDMYPLDKIQYTPTPTDFWDQAPAIAQDSRYKRFGFELGVENDALRRKHMQAYHACITFLDTQIGLILDELKATGHWDDTIVILTSDHGYQLGEHFMYGKVTLFEVCDRVPMIVRVPPSMRGATTPGSRSAGLVELLDVFPTLTDLCEVETPADLQGQSMVPMLIDPAAPGKPVAYTVVSRGKERSLGKAIRHAHWRYARWPTGEEELYDLDEDPNEWKNLVHSPEHASVLKSMGSLLDETVARAAAKREPSK